MKGHTLTIAALLVLASAAPVLASHEGTGNADRCENEVVAVQPSATVIGDECILSAVGYWSGEHVRVNVHPLEGRGLRNATLAAYTYDDAHARGLNRDATPVWSCFTGWDAHALVDECGEGEILVGLDDLPYGRYVFVQSVTVNHTIIAPTLFGVTVPTGVAVSAGTYGFDLAYNRNCAEAPDAPGC